MNDEHDNAITDKLAIQRHRLSERLKAELQEIIDGDFSLIDTAAAQFILDHVEMENPITGDPYDAFASTLRVQEIHFNEVIEGLEDMLIRITKESE